MLTGVTKPSANVTGAAVGESYQRTRPGSPASRSRENSSTKKPSVSPPKGSTSTTARKPVKRGVCSPVHGLTSRTCPRPGRKGAPDRNETSRSPFHVRALVGTASIRGGPTGPGLVVGGNVVSVENVFSQMSTLQIRLRDASTSHSAHDPSGSSANGF